jgi:hypothetical protein
MFESLFEPSSGGYNYKKVFIATSIISSIGTWKHTRRKI